MNAHDLEAHLSCFNEDYRSEQPIHPARTFTGREQVRKNWSGLYESIPDFRAELLRLAVVDDTEWAEWHWQGTKEDGSPLEERGVTIVVGANRTEGAKVGDGGQHRRYVLRDGVALPAPTACWPPGASR